ncbi:protein CysZ [Gallaecimonas xiamenensis 3-C-1]|uniref:Sulfate transporter CysZ n=1 Tax=Gallaecimonas xiamenensis 3-C-1 TaxID=745411 RepID=K2IFC8_9GAMM|nr:protein CysZ [Gallaecimonas xiamenensis 3-C-1]
MAHPVSGAHYLMRGFSLIQEKGLRRFVLFPLLVNLLLFAGAFTWLMFRLGDLVDYVLSYLPGWLEWLEYLIWPLGVVAVLVVFSFIFSALANWIAAPFNGLLAERVELMLTGEPLPDASLAEVVKDMPRVFGREWAKLKYCLPRAIGFLLLFLVPVIGQTLGAVLWFLFGAWMMAIQYLDYPFDNHKIPFEDMKMALKYQRSASFSFGMLATVLAMVPIVNLIVMPVAVCGATAMWVERFRPHLLRR